MKIAHRAIALLVVCWTALAIVLLLHSSYRDSNVSRITVSKLDDLDQAFEVGASSLRIRNPEFLKVCFAGDYVYALKDAQQWFTAEDTEFMQAFRAAGGPADVFNDDEHSSIVLLSHQSAFILQLEWPAGLSVANFGCQSVDAGDIAIKRYETNSSVEFRLPMATPKAPRRPEQRRASLCAGKLERFVESVDELLARDRVADEAIWAVIRKYLPALGCRVDEVMSIARTSRFLSVSVEMRAAHIYTFANQNIGVHFSLEKGTGNISNPHLTSRYLPFS